MYQIGSTYGRAKRRESETGRLRVTKLGKVSWKPDWPIHEVIAKANGHDRRES